jgi:asparaginyl-tRNA synthetase
METVFTSVRDLSSKAGQEATLVGWVAKFRSSGKIAFLGLRDGTGTVQVVIARNEVDDASWEAVADLSMESSVRVSGTVRQDDRAPGGYEITANQIEVIGRADEYPIQPKEHGVDFLLNNRHLWLRHGRQVAIMRVRDEIVKAIRDFFYERDFVLVDSPILTGAIGESAGTLFSTEYFDLGTAYLAQTGQLYVEAAAAALGKVYCFGPTFRAEKSKTRRHLTEFWMVEPEVAWLDSEGNMQLQEEFVSYIVGRVLNGAGSSWSNSTGTSIGSRPFHHRSID